MVGAVGVKVVNNTLLDAGDGIGITVNVGSSAVEVWNNITTCVYGIGQTAYEADNWLVNNAFCGGSAIDGQSAYHGDPGLAPDYRPTASSPVNGKGSTRAGTPTIDLDGATRSTPVLGARGS
jgi:hypothetical protein